MHKQSLTGEWQLTFASEAPMTGSIPGSVYSFLLKNGRMEDPFYRDNELAALQIMENDFTFSRTFQVAAAMAQCPKVLLRCEGLDTLCELFLNGTKVGDACNMFRTWEYDVTKCLRAGENALEIRIASPTRSIREMDALRHVGGSEDAMRGFSHIRKPHCMFGWDWGPRLPDAGIWRDILLVGVDTARIADVRIRQRHSEGRVFVTALATVEDDADLRLTIESPGGKTLAAPANTEVEIENPQLWWPAGLGEQPLYRVAVEAIQNGEVVDSWDKRIGLRTLTVIRESDQWGESFMQVANGVPFFAMGADYIPEDNIFSRITPERTRRLLEQCAAANFNVVRVWGGGYYPDDWFYDTCDELGLVVWQDFMFACANYPLDFDFEDNITAEFVDNIRRLRHHASLGLWCGNNEMEMFQVDGMFESSPITMGHYVRMFEHILPHVLRREDPDTFYWPASPSSGGSFVEPNAPDRGDVHYWEVWHGNKPFDEYRKYFFRYVSEFGFQSFPCLKTVESFTLPEDRNIISRVMEMHQRNAGANGKIMNYLSRTFLYPTSFDTLLYASQLLQAEAVKYGVEHWRRNRGRCMGAVYWQINDIWPVASWSSIDYFGRWKALHYYAKRFFAPLMISCHETGETTDRVSVVAEPSAIATIAHLSVANESRQARKGVVRWTLRNAESKILANGEHAIDLPALSSVWLDPVDFHSTDYRRNHFTYELMVDGEIVSDGSVLFTAPKHYMFADPRLDVTVNGDLVTVKASAYAKSVEITSDDGDLILSDNYFDMEKGEKSVRIIEGGTRNVRVRSVYDIR